MSLTRDQLLSGSGVEFTTVSTPELGEGAEIRVRPLSAKQCQTLHADQSDGPDDNFTVLGKVFLAAAVDESGRPLFQDGDLPRVLDLPFAVINRVATTAMEASGVTDAAVDDAAKN